MHDESTQDPIGGRHIPDEARKVFLYPTLDDLAEARRGQEIHTHLREWLIGQFNEIGGDPTLRGQTYDSAGGLLPGGGQYSYNDREGIPEIIQAIQSGEILIVPTNIEFLKENEYNLITPVIFERKDDHTFAPGLMFPLDVIERFENDPNLKSKRLWIMKEVAWQLWKLHKYMTDFVKGGYEEGESVPQNIERFQIRPGEELIYIQKPGLYATSPMITWHTYDPAFASFDLSSPETP